MRHIVFLLAVTMLVIACSGGDESSENPVMPPTPSPATALTVETQSIAEGAEVDATTTTVFYLRYNAEIKVGGSASITLNGSQLTAYVDAADGKTLVVPLSLSAGKDYTLKIAKGSVMAAASSSVSAPEFVLKFKTKSVEQPASLSSIPSEPVTATSDAAKKLYTYLYNQYGKKTISSVMANVNWNNDCAEKVHTLTGKYPAMNCYDFIHICYSPANWIDYTNIAPVQAWVNAGGLVQLMWHFNVPKSQGGSINEVTCTPSETTFKASNALISGTWENKWFYEQMDKVVATLLKLQDAGIAATWRPFHEAAGHATYKQQASWTKAWFWWGYDGAETYKKLWKTMYDYFKQKGVNNLIWVWTTQNYNGNSSEYNVDSNWYPGDSYVDIVARDLYGYNASKNKQEFAEIQARYPNKMVALGECGMDGNTNTQPGLPGDCWTAGAKWSHFMVWYQGGQGSTDTMCSDAWWTSALKNANVITRDQVPNLK